MCINPSKRIDGLFHRNVSTTTAYTKSQTTNTNSHADSGNSQPNTKSTLRRMTFRIIYGYLFNTLAYFAIIYAPSSGATFVPYPEFCHATIPTATQEDTTCTRRDLFAFQVVSFFNLTYLGLLGTYTFFFSKRQLSLRAVPSSSSSSSALLPPTPHGRYFGKLSEADSINAAIVIFQGWDFMASLFFEEHCTVVMMMHHLLAFLCGFFCLVYEVRNCAFANSIYNNMFRRSSSVCLVCLL
jgi:hypothetical protein